MGQERTEKMFDPNSSTFRQPSHPFLDGDPQLGFKELTTQELKLRASSLSIKGSSNMSRDELVEALNEYKRLQDASARHH